MPGRGCPAPRALLVRGTLVVVLFLGCAACAAGDDDDVPTSTLAGRIDVDGSSTVEPFTALAAERFQDANPRVAVVVGVSPSRTGAGFERFCAGETDLSTASRRIEPDEQRICRAHGIEYIEFQIANDAITVVVSPENDWADCLTTGELREIWKPGSPIERWSEVRRRFPDKTLALFGATEGSGTFDYFTAVIVGREGASRSDYAASEDDFVTAGEVAEHEGGLGYFGFHYFRENEDRLRTLAIDDGSGCVTPSVEAVQNGEYGALSRPLYVYAREDALHEPSVRAFLDYTLDNAISLAEGALLVPVTDEQLRRARARFDAIDVAADGAGAARPASAASGRRSGA